MSRKARLVVPGAIYHVMARSLEHYELFPDDPGREYFLKLLETCLTRTGCRCYAWVLMSTHYHLVLRLGDRDLWEVMKPLNMRYAQYHRQITGRRGPLFMDRYKSIVTQDQNYLMELVRYVHLNPVRAGICRTIRALRNYSWCGHGALVGRKARPFQDTKSVLRRFGKTGKEACDRYVQFLEEGMHGGSNKLIELVRMSNTGSEAGRKAVCWVIGDPEFQKKTIASAESKRLRISRFEKEGGGFERIAHAVSVFFNVPEEQLKVRHRGGAVSEARKVFSYIAAKEFGASSGMVAEYLGVGNAAVSAMAAAGRLLAQKRRFTI